MSSLDLASNIHTTMCSITPLHVRNSHAQARHWRTVAVGKTKLVLETGILNLGGMPQNRMSAVASPHRTPVRGPPQGTPSPPRYTHTILVLGFALRHQVPRAPIPANSGYKSASTAPYEWLLQFPVTIKSMRYQMKSDGNRTTKTCKVATARPRPSILTLATPGDEATSKVSKRRGSADLALTCNDATTTRRTLEQLIIRNTVRTRNVLLLITSNYSMIAVI